MQSWQLKVNVTLERTTPSEIYTEKTPISTYLIAHVTILPSSLNHVDISLVNSVSLFVYVSYLHMCYLSSILKTLLVMLTTVASVLRLITLILYKFLLETMVLLLLLSVSVHASLSVSISCRSYSNEQQ